MDSFGDREPPPKYTPPPPPPGIHQAPVYTTPLPPYTNFAPGPPNYGATETIIIQRPPEVVIVGGCPVCRVGVLQDDFTCLGLLCAILFFPAGLLCCLLLKEKKCTNCGATFG